MSYRYKKDIDLSKEELIAAKGRFEIAVILIAVVFFGFVVIIASLIGARD